MSAKESASSKVRRITLSGEPVVYVPLVGKHGIGREVLLDADVWQRIAARGGARCRATLEASGKLRVDQPALGPLARWILNAPRGAQVRYLNGDRFDLRRCNLNLARDAAVVGHRQWAQECAR